MDSLKLGMQGQSRGSDVVEFEIKAYGVAPQISWETILGALIFGGILYVVLGKR